MNQRQSSGDGKTGGSCEEVMETGPADLRKGDGSLQADQFYKTG